MVKVQTTEFHFICAVFGIFTTCLAFVSYLVKERLYISDSPKWYALSYIVLSFLVGTIAGPATGLLYFNAWVGGTEKLEAITLEFTRLSLCVQVMLNGIQLPGKFAKKSYRSLLVVLLPGMTLMWLSSSFLIWAVIAFPNSEGDSANTRRMPFLHALAIGSCLTPTDPVLAATIVKGRWAEQHVPPPLVHLISGESGANDGLGYPFLFLSLYLIARVGGHGQHADSKGGAAEAMAHFFGNTIGFVVLLGAVWGAVIGYASTKLMRLCRSMQYVDHESFFAFPVLLALLLIGTCGMAGSDDILASFVAGNALSWDDWFRQSTAQDSFASTFELFLNMALFIYLGATCPWDSLAPFANELSITPWSISLWRLVCLAMAILALRRVPMVILLHQLRLLQPHVQCFREAVFMGFFGPMGISSIFYLHEILRFCREDLSGEDGTLRLDAQSLYQTARVIVWFIVTSSIGVHGLAIPVYQAGVVLWSHQRERDQPPQARHRFSIRGFLDRERCAFRQATEDLHAEEERIGEQIERDILGHRRPRPSFRQLKAELD